MEQPVSIPTPTRRIADLFAMAKRVRTNVRASILKIGRTTVTGGREAQPEF